MIDLETIAAAQRPVTLDDRIDAVLKRLVVVQNEMADLCLERAALVNEVLA